MKVPIYISFFFVLSCTSRHKSDVTVLDLSNHNLSHIPDSVFSLNQLEYLQLGNSFTRYPPLSAFGNSSGESLNKVTEIPNDIEKLQKLRVLGFCFNNLQSLPKGIARLHKLDTLDLSFNEQLSILKEFENLKVMTRLKYLNIVATQTDSTTIEKLRKALPNTKIDANYEDLEMESLDPSK